MSVAIFALFLCLVPLGTKHALAISDLVFSGLDYRPIIAIAGTFGLAAFNVLSILRLASGDYISDARLHSATLLTWICLSIIAALLAIVTATIPTLFSLEEPSAFNFFVQIFLGSQLALAAALAKGVFRPTTNNASALREAYKEVKGILTSLNRRQDPCTPKHVESDLDASDWKRLMVVLPEISLKGKALEFSLKCSAERQLAGNLAAHSKSLSVGLGAAIANLRNAVLYSSDADIRAARDFFLDMPSETNVNVG